MPSVSKYCGALLLLLAFAACAPGDYDACDAAPTTPLCWDAALGTARPTNAFTLLGNRACCPVNVSDSVTIPSAYAVFVGATYNGANETHIQGSLRLAAGARLAVTTTLLAVGGNFTVGSGAVVSVTQSNATRTLITVGGCLVFEAPQDATNLTVELSVDDGNQSRSYVIFRVPSGCIEGSFGTVTTAYILMAGSEGEQAPGGAQCPRPTALSVLVGLACADDDDVATATANTTDNAGAAPAPMSNYALWWTLGGVFAGCGALTVAMAIVLLKWRHVRQRLFPFRDRPVFRPTPPPLRAVAPVPLVGVTATSSSDSFANSPAQVYGQPGMPEWMRDRR